MSASSFAVTSSERKHLVDKAVLEAISNGARVERQSDTNAVVIHGRRVNHLLHFFITLFTFGGWLIVWIILGFAGGEKRKLIQVDEHGTVSTEDIASQ